MDSDAEVDVEDVELKVCSGSEAVAERLAVDSLLLIAEIESEHTERDIERNVLHDEHAHAGRERQPRLHIGGIGFLRLAVVWTPELAVARGERKLHLVEYAETRSACKTYVLRRGDCRRILLVEIAYVGNGKRHIVGEVKAPTETLLRTK